MVQICDRARTSNTSALAHTAWLLGAVRATQGSVGDLVTPTWITLRDLSSMIKKANSDRKKRSVTGKRVTRPDLYCVIVHKGGPSLSSWLLSANIPHIFLDGSLADMHAE